MVTITIIILLCWLLLEILWITSKSLFHLLDAWMALVSFSSVRCLPGGIYQQTSQDILYVCTITGPFDWQVTFDLECNVKTAQRVICFSRWMPSDTLHGFREACCYNWGLFTRFHPSWLQCWPGLSWTLLLYLFPGSFSLVHTCSHLCKNECISQPTTFVVSVAFMSVGLRSGYG